MRHLFLLLALIVAGCGDGQPTDAPRPLAPDALREHSKEFSKGVVQVTDGVYVAIGYGLANSIMLEGDDGILIVDTMESVEAGKEVLAAFREITDKPVKAIIYTHNHTDHVFGARAFAAPGEVPVYAHRSTSYYINRVVNQIRPIITTRSMRMFGHHLADGELINDGIGPRLDVSEESTLFALPPDHTFDDHLDVTIAGLRLQLVHAPGETEDQIFIWLPDKKVLLSGDNLYRAFPNLYTIRGTAYRDVAEWAHSLDKMRALGAEYMVPSHTRPLSGQQHIDDTLTDYRDAIQFVHDQTLRYMNQGLTPDQIVERVKLPPHLAENPWLQEFYGKVSWSVRAVFDGYLGWFDGNPSTLQPLPERERADGMAELAGGADALLDKAQAALKDGRAQWALTLSDNLLLLKPDDSAVKDLRANALRTLADQEANPPARNYYFTAAHEVADSLKPGFRTRAPDGFLATLPVGNFLRAMPAFLKAEDTLDVHTKLGFHFRDNNQDFTLEIRRGVAVVHEGLAEDSVAVIETTEPTWKAIAAGQRNAVAALAGDDLDITGSKLQALRILGYFEKVD